MDNVISTYYAVVGDLLPALPVEIDVFALFQVKLSVLLRDHVKYAFVEFKAFMAPPELIQMVHFYDKLAQFCEKFGTSTTINMTQMLEMRPELVRQSNISLVASASAQMLRIFNLDETNMAATDGGMGAGVGGFSFTDPASALSHIAAPPTSADPSPPAPFTNPNPFAHFEGRVTLWPPQLLLCLQSHLAYIPAEAEGLKRVHWCKLMLDTLNEFQVKQSNWLQQATPYFSSASSSALPLLPLIRFSNNHTLFSHLLRLCVEDWSSNLPQKLSDSLFLKLGASCALFLDNSDKAIEVLAQYMHDQVSGLLRDGLFKAGWGDSVRCVLQLKSTTMKNFSFLLAALAGGGGDRDGDGSVGTGTSVWVGGGTTVSPAEEAGFAAYCSGTVAVRQLLLYISECAVAVYLECLLSNPSIAMDLNTISRLSEDVELLTKLLEDLRCSVYMRASPLAYLIQGQGPSYQSDGIDEKTRSAAPASVSDSAPASAPASVTSSSAKSTPSTPLQRGALAAAQAAERASFNLGSGS
ncbi:hypothetical protein B484DRAFT_401091, partial [Ochromonadaceae sp. CCMP2298]